MLTAEQSKTARTQLGLSQRRTAEQASVPRSYLNQFECGRWIPTDEFLAKLTTFYAHHGISDPAGPEPWNVGHSGSEPTTWDAPDDDPPDVTTDTSDLNAEPQSGWGAVAKGILALSLVGGLLLASGNFPAALKVFRRMPGDRRPRFPY